MEKKNYIYLYRLLNRVIILWLEPLFGIDYLTIADNLKDKKKITDLCVQLHDDVEVNYRKDYSMTFTEY